MEMSVTEILKELPKLSPTDREAVWKKLGEITEADLPATFRQGMRDIAEGLTVDMERRRSLYGLKFWPEDGNHPGSNPTVEGIIP